MKLKIPRKYPVTYEEFLEQNPGARGCVWYGFHDGLWSVYVLPKEGSVISFPSEAAREAYALRRYPVRGATQPGVNNIITGIGVCPPVGAVRGLRRSKVPDDLRASAYAALGSPSTKLKQDTAELVVFHMAQRGLLQIGDRPLGPLVLELVTAKDLQLPGHDFEMLDDWSGSLPLQVKYDGQGSGEESTGNLFCQFAERNIIGIW
ncbi:MAG: hypothetical protein ACRDQZ_09215 [Mycobacteriales bacterium]